MIRKWLGRFMMRRDLNYDKFSLSRLHCLHDGLWEQSKLGESGDQRGRRGMNLVPYLVGDSVPLRKDAMKFGKALWKFSFQGYIAYMMACGADTDIHASKWFFLLSRLHCLPDWLVRSGIRSGCKYAYKPPVFKCVIFLRIFFWGEKDTGYTCELVR